MRDDIAVLRDRLRQGQCCAVALVATALDRTGTRNESLLQAVSGLCSGVHAGLMCGALTGAACMLNVLDPNANVRMVPELAEWFLATIGGEYGGIACDDILSDAAPDDRSRCPAVVEATYGQAMALLERYGGTSG
jgi:hypothetical protein